MKILSEILNNNFNLNENAICQYHFCKNNYIKKIINWKSLFNRSKLLSNAINNKATDHVGTIAILSPNSMDYCLCLLGILFSGNRALLINPKYTFEAILKIIKLTSPKILFIDNSLKNLYLRLSVEFTEIEFVIINSENDKRDINLDSFISKSNNNKYVNPQNKSDDVIILMCTSGTSDSPKICQHTNKSIDSIIKTGINISFKENHTALSTFAFYHIGGLIMLLSSLKVGSTFFVLYGKASQNNILKIVLENKISSLALPVPTIIDLLNYIETDYKNKDLSFINNCRTGGQILNKNLISKWYKNIPYACLDYIYGMTEGPDVFCLSHQPDEEGNYHYNPIKSWKYNITEEGELLISGDSLFKGYLHDKKTSKKIVDGWFHTGDLVNIKSNNTIQITGRASDLIVCGGENVNPNEVENYIYNRLDIKDIVAFPIPDAKFEEQVAVVVELQDYSDLTIEDIENVCASLPIHMRPKKIIIDKFIKSSLGKINRKVYSKKFS